jgi:hypothetical protein
MSAEETVKSVEPEAVAETPAPVVEVAPEVAALLSKDPEVVQQNLEQAEPVSEPAEATIEQPAEVTETSEEAPAESAVQPTSEKPKEGAGILSFLKKHINLGEDKKAKTEPEAETAAAPATTEEAAPTEPAEEKPFEGGKVLFRTRGTVFGYISFYHSIF